MKRILKIALLFLVLGFAAMRLVHLNADFPSGITWSGELYTDDGQNAASAIRHVLTGHWYMPGDANTAVYAPIGHILHRISFFLFGLSLTSVRITIVAAFLLLVTMTALLVRRSFGDFAALLTALLMTSNYVGFAYSRLGTMDLVATCLVVASLYAAGGLRQRTTLLRLVLASFLLVLGMLTKLTAVFAIPLLAFCAWRGGSTIRQRVTFVAVSGLTLLVLYGGYRLVSVAAFPWEYVGYNRQTVGDIYTSFHAFVRHLPRKITDAEYLGAGFVDIAVVMIFGAFAFSKRFRSEPLVHLLLGYVAAYAGMLTLHVYGPPRYYLPLLVPLAGLCGPACTALAERLRQTRRPAAAIIPAVVLAALSLIEGWRIVSYLARPRYSFYNMTQAVGKIIREREGTSRGVLLYGDIASSVSLETGTNGVNTLPGTDQSKRIGDCHPRYMIVLSSNIVQVAEWEGAEAVELGRWDVFDNFYADHQPVRLYSVTWP